MDFFRITLLILVKVAMSPALFVLATLVLVLLVTIPTHFTIALALTSALMASTVKPIQIYLILFVNLVAFNV